MSFIVGKVTLTVRGSDELMEVRTKDETLGYIWKDGEPHVFDLDPEDCGFTIAPQDLDELVEGYE